MNDPMMQGSTNIKFIPVSYGFGLWLVTGYEGRLFWPMVVIFLLLFSKNMFVQ
jgi:hypothetical protein